MPEIGFGELGLMDDGFLNPANVIQCGVVPNRIDLLMSESGVDFEDIWKGKVEKTIDGIPANFIGKAELIKNKFASGRPKNLVDVKNLEARLIFLPPPTRFSFCHATQHNYFGNVRFNADMGTLMVGALLLRQGEREQ